MKRCRPMLQLLDRVANCVVGCCIIEQGAEGHERDHSLALGQSESTPNLGKRNFGYLFIRTSTCALAAPSCFGGISMDTHVNFHVNFHVHDPGRAVHTRGKRLSTKDNCFLFIFSTYKSHYIHMN